MSDTIPTFKFYRTNEPVSYNGIKGTRGILEAGDLVYFTIERDISKFVNIPFGIYFLRMEYSPSHPERQQFRIMGHSVKTQSGATAAILIHVGNNPANVQGCIAPGTAKSLTGVAQSQMAMNELFSYCGGFSVKENAAILEVVTQF